MADQEPAVVVKNLYKTFKLPHEQHTGIKQLIINYFKRVKGYKIQKVLNDISFDIKKGEFFGIVGRNGSGKSTLLKILAGIYVPNKGHVKINGSLTPFIELGVGFNPELTGRENIYLNGALLGFSKSEVDGMYDSVVEFAELEEFMDQKLKNYSSGMQVRLAFSIAIRSNSDILLLDEVLAVGDAEFQRKCYDYFMSLKEKKQTVILVTHDMGAVRQYCDRALIIEEGKIVKTGNSETIAQEYFKLFSDNTQDVGNQSGRSWGVGGVVIKKPKIDVSDERIIIKTDFVASRDLPAPIFGFTLFNSSGTNIFEANTRKEKQKTNDMKKNEKVSISWSIPNVLSDGTYSLSVACCDQSATKFYRWTNNICKFSVTKSVQTAGIINPEIKITNFGGSVA